MVSETVPHPLLVVLSGVNAGAADIESQCGWTPFAVAPGLTVAYGVPSGTGWNAGGRCGTAATSKVNDIAYLAAIVADARKHLAIDPKRVTSPVSPPAG